MDSAKLLIIGGVVLGGFYIINKSKKNKDLANAQALTDANSQTNSVGIQEYSSEFYNKAEATKKALEVVTKWISFLDAIPKEFLTQENRNIINQRLWAEKEKQAKIDYDKALAEAKLKKLPKFTFQGTTYWTANQEDERNGSFITTGLVTVWKLNNPYGNYFVNSFKQSEPTIKNISLLINPNEPATLGDYIKLVKTQKFSEVYDGLKVVFTELPKSDVDRLVIMLPKYLMAGIDNFAYFLTEYEKNPFTIEEQLYLKDINLYGVLSKKRV